ncbi:MAG TPA: MFS transporter [Actinocatenispora sp.]
MSAKNRLLALVVLCAAQVMVILDGTIVNVALPSIQDSLGFDRSSLAWVMNAYLVGFGGLLPLAGRLGDLVGRRRVFTIGLVAFVVASLACGLATDPVVLVAGRFLQGAGGALASAVVLGMLVTTFPEPAEQSRAIGAFTFVGAGGASLGTFLGGVLTQALSWHWIFLVNLPIGIVAAVLAPRVLARDRGVGLRAGADTLGAALVTAGLMLGVYTIVSAGDRSAAGTAVTGALAVALLAAFLVRQRTARTPLLPLRLFGSRLVSGANLVQFLMVAAMFGFQFLTALYLRQVLGFDALRTSLAFLPTPVVIAAVSLGLSARLYARYGQRSVLLTGLAAIVAGLVLLGGVPADSGYLTHVLPAVVVMGAGFAAAMPALTTYAMADVAPGDSGVASGLFNTTQQVGGALGLAVLARLADAVAAGHRAAGDAPAVAQTAGSHVAYAVGAVLVAGALVTAAVTLRTPGAGRDATPETVSQQAEHPAGRSVEV